MSERADLLLDRIIRLLGVVEPMEQGRNDDSAWVVFISAERRRLAITTTDCGDSRHVVVERGQRRLEVTHSEALEVAGAQEEL